MTERLKGKRIMITGAAQGIGLAIARACVKEGASLFLVDLDAGLLETEAKALQAGGAPLAYAIASITDTTAISAAVERAATEIGPINALITMPASMSSMSRWRPAMRNGSAASTSISKAPGIARRPCCPA